MTGLIRGRWNLENLVALQRCAPFLRDMRCFYRAASKKFHGKPIVAKSCVPVRVYEFDRPAAILGRSPNKWLNNISNSEEERDSGPGASDSAIRKGQLSRVQTPQRDRLLGSYD